MQSLWCTYSISTSWLQQLAVAFPILLPFHFLCLLVHNPSTLSPLTEVPFAPLGPDHFFLGDLSNSPPLQVLGVSVSMF